MKLETMGALLVRLTAAGFVLRGITGLAKVALVYSKLHRVVESNAALKQGFQETMRNGVISALVALACGILAWLLSERLGKLLAKGLETAAPATQPRIAVSYDAIAR